MVPLRIAKVLILPKFGLDGMPDAHPYTCAIPHESPYILVLWAYALLV